MSTEFIPVYPTMAFASRADHLAWLAQQEPKIEELPPAELLTKDALKAEKLRQAEIDTVCLMLFQDLDTSKYSPAQKLSAIWQYANKSPETFADYQAALQAARGA